MPLSLAGTMVLALATGCGESEPSPLDPTDPGTTPAEVNSYLTQLPTWSAFTADVNGPDQPPTATGSPEPVADEVVDVEQIEDDGSVTVLPDVIYSCQEQPYSIAENPERMVMYNPDVEVLWPGALIQGKSRKELGSLLGLPIAERTPISVSIPSFASSDNFREVPTPNQASVGAAVGSIIGNATASGLAAPSAIQFDMETYHSENSFALSVGVSGSYLGFSASATGDFSRSAAETTVTAQFYQRMFEVVVAPPQTPAAFFSSDFTDERLQEQVTIGRMGPDNIPVYVSNVVYGRMMMFSFTSSESEQEIRGTLQAAYNSIGGSASASLSAKQESILQQAKIAVTSRGGDAQDILDVIRSGDWSGYFTDEAPLSTAAPLSYTFRNLSDGSIATVTEATAYNIRECRAIPATPGTFSYLDAQVETAPFAGGVQTLTGDVNGDGRTDLIWNQLQTSTNQLYVGMSAGDGTFAFSAPFVHPESAPEGWGNYTVDVADINGDAYADLVWNYLGSDAGVGLDNKTYVGLGNGDGTFGTPSVRIHGGQNWGAYWPGLVGDAMGPTGSGDGLADMIWVRHSSLGIYAGESRGDSQFDFAPFASLSGSNWNSLYTPLAMDFDGDGDTDVALSYPAGANRTYPITSNGDRSWTLGAPQDRPQTDGINYAIRVGDVTGLGSESLIRVDTASTASGITVGQWTGSGFDYSAIQAAPTPYGTEYSPPFTVEVGDVDGDGDTDVIWGRREAGANRTFVSLGQGDGTFDFSTVSQLHPDAGTNWSQYRMFVADVNGDGRDDIIWNWPAATNRIYTAIGKN
jgi:hypothetical protein